MTRLAVLLVAVLALAGPAAAAQRASLPDIEDEVMCVECGTSLAASDSPGADQERAFIRREIARGKDKAQIKADLVDEYGSAVLAQPGGGGFDLSAWIVPIVLVVAGLAGVALAARRWRRASGAPAAASAPPLDPADARRLDADLAAHDR